MKQWSIGFLTLVLLFVSAHPSHSADITVNPGDYAEPISDGGLLIRVRSPGTNNLPSIGYNRLRRLNSVGEVLWEYPTGNRQIKGTYWDGGFTHLILDGGYLHRTVAPGPLLIYERLDAQGQLVKSIDLLEELALGNASLSSEVIRVIDDSAFISLVRPESGRQRHLAVRIDKEGFVDVLVDELRPVSVAVESDFVKAGNTILHLQKVSYVDFITIERRTLLPVTDSKAKRLGKWTRPIEGSVHMRFAGGKDFPIAVVSETAQGGSLVAGRKTTIIELRNDGLNELYQSTTRMKEYPYVEGFENAGNVDFIRNTDFGFLLHRWNSLSGKSEFNLIDIPLIKDSARLRPTYGPVPFWHILADVSGGYARSVRSAAIIENKACYETLAELDTLIGRIWFDRGLKINLPADQAQSATPTSWCSSAETLTTLKTRLNALLIAIAPRSAPDRARPQRYSRWQRVVETMTLAPDMDQLLDSDGIAIAQLADAEAVAALLEKRQLAFNRLGNWEDRGIHGVQVSIKPKPPTVGTDVFLESIGALLGAIEAEDYPISPKVRRLDIELAASPAELSYADRRLSVGTGRIGDAIAVLGELFFVDMSPTALRNHERIEDLRKRKGVLLKADSGIRDEEVADAIDAFETANFNLPFTDSDPLNVQIKSEAGRYGYFFNSWGLLVLTPAVVSNLDVILDRAYEVCWKEGRPPLELIGSSGRAGRTLTVNNEGYAGRYEYQIGEDQSRNPKGLKIVDPEAGAVVHDFPDAVVKQISIFGKEEWLVVKDGYRSGIQDYWVFDMKAGRKHLLSPAIWDYLEARYGYTDRVAVTPIISDMSPGGREILVNIMADSRLASEVVPWEDQPVLRIDVATAKVLEEFDYTPGCGWWYKNKPGLMQTAAQ